MKFCTNCGQQMPDDAKFCPKCGTKQAITNIQSSQPMQPMEPPVSSQSEQSNIQEQSEQSETVDNGQIQDELGANIDRGSTTKNLVGLAAKNIPVGPLMSENTVIQKKIELGYSDDPNNFVFAATPINWSDMLTISGLTGMKSQNYILAFEQSGLLLMGCDGLLSFNGDDHFIKNEHVQKIDLENYGVTHDWDHMYLQVDDQIVELLIQRPTFSIIKWHRRNFKNVLVYTM